MVKVLFSVEENLLIKIDRKHYYANKCQGTKSTENPECWCGQFSASSSYIVSSSSYFGCLDDKLKDKRRWNMQISHKSRQPPGEHCLYFFIVERTTTTKLLSARSPRHISFLHLDGNQERLAPTITLRVFHHHDPGLRDVTPLWIWIINRIWICEEELLRIH